MPKHFSDLAVLLSGIAVCGGLASVARFLLSDWIQRRAGEGFPWGTVIVNAVGCLLFGMIWALFDKFETGSATLRISLLAGVCGALTTFSTFAFDTTRMLEGSAYGLAFAHVLGQAALGISLVFCGIWCVRWLF